MKKNIYLCVIWTITLACIIFSTQSKLGRINLHMFNFFERNQKSERLNISKDFQNFSEIEINGNVMEIEITKGNKFHIDSEFSIPNLEPVISFEDDKLFISQKNSFLNFGNNYCKVKLYIPENTELKTAKIETDVGDININSIKCKKLNIESDVGNIFTDKADCNKITIKTDVGNIKLKTKDGLENYNVIAKSDLGSITVGGNKYNKTFEAEADTLNQIYISSDIGKITIN